MILDLKFRAAVQNEQEISYTVRTENSQIIVDDESDHRPWHHIHYAAISGI
jgi:hypothetical protein